VRRNAASLNIPPSGASPKNYFLLIKYTDGEGRANNKMLWKSIQFTATVYSSLLGNSSLLQYTVHCKSLLQNTHFAKSGAEARQKDGKRRPVRVGSVFFALIFLCYFLFIKEKKVKAD
jgi:hypothetical protein